MKFVFESFPRRFLAQIPNFVLDYETVLRSNETYYL